MTLMIKDIPIDERPREKLLKYGAQSLSNANLLAIILKTGTKGISVDSLSLKVLKKIEFIKLATINKEVLTSIKGIGTTKAIELLAAIELGRRLFSIKEVKEKTIYNNPKIIYENNKHLFLNKNQEHFYCIYLNNKKQIIERKLLFMGTVNKAVVHPREIFKEAYLFSASSIICMHNHPSGDPTPSIDDIILTNSLVEIGKIQQIPVVDHIIFGNDKYYSFHDNNDIKRL